MSPPSPLSRWLIANKRTLNCRVLVEGANAPTTPAAEHILAERGIEVLPAILCNGGGVTVSYFEWLQNRPSETWTLQRVDALLKEHMTRTASLAKESTAQYGCNLRLGSYCAAIQHIADVYSYRGIFL